MSLVEVFPEAPESSSELVPFISETSTASSPDPASMKNVVVLKNRSEGGFGPESTVYLLGTAHVSTQSCEDVRELIQAVKPQVNDPRPSTLDIVPTFACLVPFYRGNI